jgi:hypothetical protein
MLHEAEGYAVSLSRIRKGIVTPMERLNSAPDPFWDFSQGILK